MRILAAALVLSLAMAPTWLLADEQQIAPGTGLQSAVVANTGANGLCETAAAIGDIQAAPVGQAAPNRNEVKCGANKVVDTVAAGDDVQLVAVGASCSSASKVVIDTGENGIPESTPAVDDSYSAGIALGVAPANTPCVLAGADGVAQTAAVAGDDTQLLTAGSATPGAGVVLCGPNLVADTTANNLGAGDDQQLVAVGAACTANQIVVDAGLDGIANTLAQGPDLMLRAINPAKINISAGKATGEKFLKFVVGNVESSAGAPPSRNFKLTTTTGTCPNGTVIQVDADGITPGLQATGSVALGSKTKVSLVARLKLEDVTSANKNAPFRCTFDVSVVALDTTPSVDDAENPENNTVRVDLEVIDRNDL